MKSNYIKDVLILLLNIILIIIFTTNSFLLHQISIGNFYTTYTAIIVSILFLIIMFLKSTDNIILINDLQRINAYRLFSLIIYKFLYVSLIIMFLYMNQISFIVALFLIFGDMLNIIFNLVIVSKNIIFRMNKTLILTREFLFNITIIVLLNSNMPFELYALPVDNFLISLYTTSLMYILYLQFEIIRYEL